MRPNWVKCTHPTVTEFWSGAEGEAVDLAQLVRFAPDTGHYRAGGVYGIRSHPASMLLVVPELVNPEFLLEYKAADV